MNYFEALKQLSEQLKSDKNIHLIKSDIPAKKTTEKKIAKEIKSINDAFEIDFSGILTDSFDLFGSTHIRWNNTNGTDGGEIHFIKLNDCFYKDYNLAFSAKTAEEKSLLENFHPFDDHPEAGDGIMAGFIIDLKSKSADCWLYDNGKLFKLAMDIRDYFRLAVLTKGLFYWQYLFVNKKDIGKNGLIKEQLNKIKVNLMNDKAAISDELLKQQLLKI